MAKASFEITGVALLDLLGEQDKNLKRIEAELPGLVIQNRGNVFNVTGDQAQLDLASEVFEQLAEMIKQGLSPDPQGVSETIRIIQDNKEQPAAKILASSTINTPAKTVRAKTAGQKEYLDAIDQNTITFGIGPAGTGKTYLAVAKAVEALYRKEVSRIILTRPAVEAGERLGFLPGTLSEKIDPYLRPLFDSLQEMLEPDVTARLMEAGVIEVAPLAYMRGRTLNDSFIILDEAQNTTGEQMKMFLTRLGFNSKMVVTGDVTQIDLPGGKSGLGIAQTVLADVEGLNVQKLTSRDVVRHELVTRIVEAYDRAAVK